MLVRIRKDYESVGIAAAQVIAERLLQKPNMVLGLATGSTPLALYRELIRLHVQGGLDFSKVTTFNLDEYVGLLPSHDQSYHYFMHEFLFDYINVDPRNIFIPDGMASDIDAFCNWYEEQIVNVGGIDLQVLGIGSNGHIAFNEPGSSLASRTRIKTLTERTVRDNARFFATMDEVPRQAITMGVGTIMDAREVVLLATGENKADAVKATVEGPISAAVPASVLQMHRRAIMIIDEAAASKLSPEYIEESAYQTYAEPAMQH